MPEILSKRRKTGWMVSGALFLLAVAAIGFIGLCIVLESIQSVSPGRPPQSQPDNSDIFLSPSALIVYCTVLAGLLGASIRLLSERLRTGNVQAGEEGSATAAAARVFLGGAFAFAAAFLVPHALANGTISTSYNVWSLMIIGGVAGYASSLVTVGVQEGLEDLMAGMRRGVAEAIVKEEMTKTLVESARDALTLPEPIAFAGHVEVDVVDQYDKSVVQRSSTSSFAGGTEEASADGRNLELTLGGTYRVRIRIVPQGANSKPRSTWPFALPIEIEGVPGNFAPLDVRIDYGFLTQPADRHVEDVSTLRETTLPVFTFSTPQTALVEAAASPAAPEEPAVPRRLTVSVLQNKIPYVRKQIPIHLAGEPQSMPLYSSSP